MKKVLTALFVIFIGTHNVFAAILVNSTKPCTRCEDSDIPPDCTKINGYNEKTDQVLFRKGICYEKDPYSGYQYRTYTVRQVYECVQEKFALNGVSNCWWKKDEKSERIDKDKACQKGYFGGKWVKEEKSAWGQPILVDKYVCENRCPSLDGVIATSPIDAKTIDECYIEKSTPPQEGSETIEFNSSTYAVYKDKEGNKYILTGDCPYQ